MQEILSSSPPMVTVICDPNKSRARHHRSIKLGSKLNYLNKKVVFMLDLTAWISYREAASLKSQVASTITYVFQPKQLTKCVSHPYLKRHVQNPQCWTKHLETSSLFDFPFTTSETKLDYYHQIITRKRIYELSHELPSNLRLKDLRDLEIWRKSLKCLNLMASTQPATQ